MPTETKTVAPDEKTGQSLPGAQQTEKPVEATDASLEGGKPKKQFEYLTHKGSFDSDFTNWLNDMGANGFQFKSAMITTGQEFLIFVEREVDAE